MKPITTLIAISALGIVSVPVKAGISAYLIVVGKTQGQFKGAKESKSFRMPVTSYTFPKQSTGTAARSTNNKSSNGTVQLVLPGADMAEFQKAAKIGEVLTDVKIEAVKPAGAGKVEQFLTVELKNALVSSIQIKSSSEGKSTITEPVTLTYEQIMYTYKTNNVLGVDDWMSATF